MEITPELLKQLFPATGKILRDRWIPFWNELLPKYGIDNELRLAAFLATVGIESDHLRATREYASGADYDIYQNPKKAAALGNTEPGDGPRFKGRGGIQRTGRNNYKELNRLYGDKLGVNFLLHPEKLEEIEHAVHSDCLFWVGRNLSSLADEGKFYEIQGIVNRGQAGKMPLAWEERKDIYLRALRFLPDDFRLTKQIARADIFDISKELPSEESPQNDPPETQPQPNLDSPSNPASFAADQTSPTATIRVSAPAAEGSTKTAAKATILGITVPAGIGILVKALTDLISQGFISASQIGDFVMNLVKENQKYVLLLVLALMILLALKKLLKQIGLWLQMWIAARSDLNNVEIKPQ